ncbi:kinase-like domain-containing protein, partial [Mycena leptocephala]
FARKDVYFGAMDLSSRMQITNKVRIMQALRESNHVVRYHDRYVDREARVLHIFMEYCGRGDLSKVIKSAHQCNRPISEEDVWCYIIGILSALDHCHNIKNEVKGNEGPAQIIHRDLIPDNVLLDDTNTVKVADFGLSRTLHRKCLAKTYAGVCDVSSCPGPKLVLDPTQDLAAFVFILTIVRRTMLHFPDVHRNDIRLLLFLSCHSS